MKTLELIKNNTHYPIKDHTDVLIGPWNNPFQYIKNKEVRRIIFSIRIAISNHINAI